MANRMPSKQRLNEVLEYDVGTGFLFWKTRPLSDFSCDQKGKVWNIRYSGKRAFTYLDKGYFYGSVEGTRVAAHRVIWKMHHDAEPEALDHINHQRDDNRIENLRPVTKAENSRNRERPKNTKNPYPGVRRSDRHWQASITHNYKTKYLGYFRCLGKAVKARISAEQRYGFHKNHGRDIAARKREPEGVEA